MYRGRDGPRGGAEHLARIHGTEEDKVNCPFYFKIGACRHGDRCSRQHHRPPFSQTIVMQHMWQNPVCAVVAAGGDAAAVDHDRYQEEFDDFFFEIFEEFHKFGRSEEVQVCENLGDHMVGNVYVKFYDEEDAESALTKMNGRWYGGRILRGEYSPVTDFREARCRQYDESACGRGPYCNFMHVKGPSKGLLRFLQQEFNYTGGGLKGIAGMNTMKMMSSDSGRYGGGGGGGGGGRRDDSRDRGSRGGRRSRSRSRERR